MVPPCEPFSRTGASKELFLKEEEKHIMETRKQITHFSYNKLQKPLDEFLSGFSLEFGGVGGTLSLVREGLPPTTIVKHIF